MKRFLTILSLSILALACQKQPDVPTPDPEPKPEAVTLSLTPQSLVLQVGESQQLTATVTPSGKSVSWSSSAPEIASVDNSGKVTGAGPGSATISASVEDKKQTCEVTVIGGASLLGTMSSDAEILNGAGGETVVDILAESSSFTVTSNSDWLSCERLEASGKKQVVIKTEKNATKAVRTGIITIADGAKKQAVAIKQRPYIFSRSQMGSKTMTNGITLSYSGTKWNRIYALLPVPKTNQYQEITDFSVTPGVVMDCPDGVNSYVMADITSNFPSSGGNLVMETFYAKAYSLVADLNCITDIPEYDPESAPCKMYLKKEDNGLIDPTHAEIVSTAAGLWNTAEGDLLAYAKACYGWTAANMNYGNMNTGLHRIADLMKTKLGDCGNFSSVFISLLRAKGIPARHIVMISTQENGYHVRAEFYIPAYGWIPADPTFYHDDRGGNYFGRHTGTYIVTSLGINNICKNPDGNDFVADLMQTYWLWWWWSNPGTSQSTQHVFSRF